MSNEFLQLVVAQLRNQNPLDPQDGAEFLSELAQMSSLSELVEIRSLMQSLNERIGALSEVEQQLGSLGGALPALGDLAGALSGLGAEGSAAYAKEVAHGA